jgi:WD40 repeat protein
MKELTPITGSAAALFGGGKDLIAVLDENSDAEFDHARGGVVRIWRLEGEAAREVAHAKVPGNVSGITFIADSPFFATSVNEDDTSRLDFWQTSSGQSAADSLRPVLGSNLSPNGKYFWSKFEDLITLSKTDTGECVFKRLRAVDFSPDGRFLVTTSFDGDYGELTETIVWDVTGDSLRRLHSLGKTVVYQTTGNKISPDGTRFAQVMADNRIKVWNTLTGQLVAYVKYIGAFKGVAFTYDGQFMAVAAGTNVTLWPTTREWKSSEVLGERTGESLALSSEGKLMALADKARVTNRPESLDSGVFSRDMKYKAVLGSDGPMVIEVAKPSHVVQLTNNATARSEEGESTDGQYHAFAFSGDSKLLAAATRSRIDVWDWRTGRLLHVINVNPYGNEDFNQRISIVFDEDDNNTLVSADIYEALIWNLSDARVVGRVELQEVSSGTNFTTALSRNGKFVSTTLNVYATGDKSAYSKTSVWQLRPEDVWKNACSRLSSGFLSDADWKKEFGTEELRDTCNGLALSKRPE